MRPTIHVKAVKVGNEILVKLGTSLHHFGTLCFPVSIYQAYINTLATGSLAAGDGGLAIVLVEEEFDKF